MSRAYQMEFRIYSTNRRELERAEEALEEIWCLDDNAWDCKEEGYTSYSGEASLCGGEDESHFFNRVVEAVREAVGRKIRIGVDATYLEALPFETYDTGPDEDSYD